jgi:WD40 repeat protein
MRGSHFAVSWNTGSASVLVVAMLLTGCTDATEPKDELRLEALTATSLTGIVGTEVAPVPTVRVSNHAGRPVTGIEVFFEFMETGSAIKNASNRTNTEGIATVGWWWLGTKAGAYTIRARLGKTAAIAFQAIAEPGPAAQIVAMGGDNQGGLAGATLDPLRLLVSDSYSNPVPRVPVTFAVISGGGSIDGSAVLTDSLGIATSAAWILGPVVGIQHVRALAGSTQTTFTALALVCDEVCAQLELAFVREGGIFLTDVLGTATRQLTGGRDDNPAWSPDGRRIAFVRYVSRNEILVGDLYLMNADGSNVVRRASGSDLAAPGGGDAQGFRSPAWSPDGRKLAVDHGNCKYDCNIYLMSADDDGNPPVHLADLAAQPTWSPDGKKIAFVSLSGDDGYHALHVMNADGSQVTPITVRDAGGIFYPAWSPDGRRIAFTKCIGGGCNIVVVNADGSASVQLTTGARAVEPAWSPDGTRIAFTLSNYTNGAHASLAYVFAHKGGTPIPIVASGQHPAWRRSPNE